MGTIFEPFIIAFWVFIIALVGFVLAGLIYVIREHKKDKTKKDEIESTEKIIKK